MDEATYQMTLEQAWIVAKIVEPMPLAEMLEAGSLAESVGPVLDPTLWISHGQKFQEDRRLLKALRELQVTIAAMKSQARQ